MTPNWLWDCAERWEKVDERLYSLCKSNVTVTVVDPPAHCSSPEDNAADRSPDLPLELAAAASTSGQPLQRQISEESLNPFLAFSSEDLKGMDKEVEDILSNDSSSSDSDSAADGEDKESSDEEEEESSAAVSATTKQRQVAAAAAPVVQSLSESSSSDDSMTGTMHLFNC